MRGLPTLRADSAGRSPWLWVGAVILGMLACVATLYATSQLKYLVILLVAWLVAAVFLLSGNLRLACLYTILFLAPLRIGQPYDIIPHMGGAAAFWIDGIDPILLTLLYLQLRDIRQGRRAEYRFPRALWFWSGMIALGVVSIVIAPYHVSAAQEAFRMAKLLLLALVLLNEITRRRQFVHAVVALLIGVYLNSILAAAQWALGHDFGLQFLGEGSREGFEAVGSVTLLTREFVFRPGGLMGAGNLYAAYLALLVPVAVALVLAPVGRGLRRFAGLAVVVSLPPLVFTLSRSGWIAFAVGFAAVLVLGMWHPVSRRVYMFARASIVALAVVVAVVMSPMIVQRIYESDPNALDVRLEWFEIARKMVVDKPVLGVGLNNYVFRQLGYGKESGPDEMNARYGNFWPVVHSTWAVTWAEQGTLGFMLFVAMHVAIIAVGVANLRIRDPMMHAIGAGLLAGILALMVDGVGSFFIRMDQQARVFWIVVGLLLAVGYWRIANEESGARGEEPSPARGRAPRSPPSGWLPVPPNPLRNAPRRSSAAAEQVRHGA
jgi:putative inorganic carbon (hco3(-)) transporter